MTTVTTSREAVEREARLARDAHLHSVEKMLLVLIAERDEFAAEVARLRAHCSEALQVVGHLAQRAGAFDHPHTVKALGNLLAASEGQPRPHSYLLPLAVIPDGQAAQLSAQGAHLACSIVAREC